MPQSREALYANLPQQAQADLDRYLSYGWEPHVVAKLLRTLHGLNLTPDDIRAVIRARGPNRTGQPPYGRRRGSGSPPPS